MQDLTAFAGTRVIARGDSAALSGRHAELTACAGMDPLLVYDDLTGRLTDLDTGPTPRPRGRPKLGVAAREVTLLPRHWDWLASQPGGASAALRRLVETGSRAMRSADLARQSREAAYHFMHSIAGDFPGYEAALRALFADDLAAFQASITDWPPDIRDYALKLAGVDAAAPPP